MFLVYFSPETTERISMRNGIGGLHQKLWERFNLVELGKIWRLLYMKPITSINKFSQKQNVIQNCASQIRSMTYSDFRIFIVSYVSQDLFSLLVCIEDLVLQFLQLPL